MWVLVLGILDFCCNGLACQPPILWTQQQTPEIEAAKAQIIAAEQAVIGNQLRWQALQQQVQLNNALQAQQMELQRQKELRMAARAALPYRSPTPMKPIPETPEVVKVELTKWEGMYPSTLTTEERLKYCESMYQMANSAYLQSSRHARTLIREHAARVEEAILLLEEGAEKEEVIAVLRKR